MTRSQSHGSRPVGLVARPVGVVVMPMPPYPIHCYTKGCPNLAVYKIAARWSDGITSELKTYALCCAACLKSWYDTARQKRAVCHLAANEALDVPGIFNLQRGRRDQKLQRLDELERQVRDE